MELNSILVGAALLLLSAAILQKLITNEITYPPVVFCAAWGAALLWLSLTGDRYLPLSNDTIEFFVAAAFMFCVGAAGAVVLPSIDLNEARLPREVPNWLIPSLTVVVLLATPLYVRRIMEMVGPVGAANFLYTLRVRTIDPNAVEGIGPVAGVVPFAMICAMTSAVLPPRTAFGRFTARVLIANTLILTILTGSRAAPMSLVFSLVAIAAIRRRIRVRSVVWTAAAAVTLFAAMGLFLRKGTARPEASVRENLTSLAHDLEDYTLGGMVAFNSIADDRRAIPDNGSYLRTFDEMANRLGARIEVPPLHLQYSPIGNGLSTNVYTMYYTYFSRDGKIGALVLTLLCGFVSALIHRAALRGGLVSTLFFGAFTAAATQSVFNESFFTNANFLLKLALFSGLLILLLRGTRMNVAPNEFPVSAT